MMKLRLALAVTLVLNLVAAGALAQQADDEQSTDVALEALQSAIRSNRKAVIAVNLGLTGDEAAAFWPVYDRYQKEMNAVGDRLVAVIREYSESFSTLDNEKAMKLMDEYLAVEADRVSIRRAYLDDFAKSVPGRKVARFYQIENKIDAVQRFELAARIPIVGEGGVPPE